MMRYLAARNVRLIYRNASGKQRIDTIPAGSLTPAGAEIRGLEDLLALDLLRAVTPEEAASVSRWTTVDVVTTALNWSVTSSTVG